jgi:hypothetical protein
LNRKQKSSTRRQKESAKIEIEESLAPPNEETGAVQDNFYRDSTVPLNSFDVPPISRNVAQSENPEGTNGQTAHESSTEPHFMAVFESADMPLSRDLPPQLVSKIKPLESVMKDDVLVQDVSEREINQLQELFSDTSMVKFPSSDPIISEEPADVTGIELNAEEIVIIGRAGAERIRYEDVKIASLAYSKLSSRSVNFKTCLEIINTEHRRYQAWDRTLLHGSTSIDGTLVESDKPLHDIYNALIPRISKDAIPDWLSERPVNENAIPRLSSFVDYDNYLLALAITALQPPPASSNSANTES